MRLRYALIHLRRLGTLCINRLHLCLQVRGRVEMMPLMKQASLGLGTSTKRTRKAAFLAEMERVVPWAALVGLVAPYAPEGRRGRPPFAVETMLRIHFMQQWFTLSDPAMEDALHDMPLLRDFAGLGGWSERLPDETTILRFRHLLEEHQLAPQMLQTVNDLLHAKGLLLKAGTVVEANALLHGEEVEVFGDAGYQGADKRDDASADVRWNVAMRSGQRRALDTSKTLGQLQERLEQIKASIRAKVEHPFRVIKRQFGHVKVRYRGLEKNTAQLVTLFALSNLWMVRRKWAVLDG